MHNKQNKDNTANSNPALKRVIGAMLLAGSLGMAQAAQDITAKEAEQINAELAPVVNPQANAEKVGSVPEDPAAAVGTRFGYQGTLRLSGDRAQGAYDFRFKLYDQTTGGAQLGATTTANDLMVTDGLFSTELDFGQANIDGDDIFLQIEVRDGASTGGYTALSPRQRINATPYAVRALTGGDGGSSPWTVSGTSISYEAGNVGIGAGATNGLLTLNSPAGQPFPLIVRVDGSARLVLRENGGLVIGDLASGSGSPAPASGLLVSKRTELRDTTEANLTNGSGVLVIGPEEGENLAIDGNEILARSNGSAAPLYVGAEEGSIVNSTTGQGLMAIGSETGNHIAIDGNDIQKKSGNSTGTLRLNFYGGEMQLASPSAKTVVRGDLQQPVAQGGALKAAVFIANCGGTVGDIDTIHRQYNGVDSTAISTAITATANGPGKCIIDFPFDVNGRFWSANALNAGTQYYISAMCVLGTQHDKLSCTRFVTTTGAVASGTLIVLVY